MARLDDRPGLVEQAIAIGRLGGPTLGFFLVQNLSSLACLSIVGRLGDSVLAGLGAAGALYGVVLALLYGVDTGVQAMTSRAVGAGAVGAEDAARPGEILTAAIVGSAAFGAVLAGLTWAFGPQIVALMVSDPAAALDGGRYIAALAPSLLFLAIVIPIDAGWIGAGRPLAPFLVYALLAPVQVGVTLLLVAGAGPIAPMGAQGAGLAGSVSALVTIGLQGTLAMRVWPVPGLFARPPRLRLIGKIAAIGWPVSAQQSLFQFGLMIAFVIIARLGVASAAVANVLVSLMTLPIQATTGLGFAAATLVGQTLGRGEAGEARRWGWRTALAGAALTGPLGLAAAAAPEPLLGLFLHDPSSLALAVWPVRILGLGVGLDAIGRILGYALRGAGATKLAAGIPFASQWLLQLPLMWVVGVQFGLGILGVTLVQTGLAGIDGLLMAWIWAGHVWTRAQVSAGPA